MKPIPLATHTTVEMHVLHTFLPYIGLLVALTTANRCPDPDDLGPSCTCSVDANEPKTTCKEIEQVEELRKVFSDTGDYPLVIFVLQKSVLSYFPASALKEKSVRQLRFSETSMVGLFDRVPEQNNKLDVIMLHKCNVLRGIEWSLLRNLNNLTGFYTDGVTIRSLGKEFMENMPMGIVEITLISTEMSKINDRAFGRLTQLNALGVMDGKITTLKRTMFPVENALQRINFANNLISKLPDNIFSDMPKLDYLSLENNPLTTISEPIFKEISERKLMMSMEGNNITCDCNIRWVLAKQWKLTAKCHLPKQFKEKPIGGSGGLSDTDLNYCDDV